MKYNAIWLLFISVLVLSFGSYAGEKNCAMHLVEKSKTEDEIKKLTDKNCPSVCKEWLCTTGGHGRYTGKYSKEEDWRVKSIWKIMCQCHYDY